MNMPTEGEDLSRFWLSCLCPLANLFMPFFEFIMGFIVVYTHSAFTSTKSKCTFGANTRDMKIYIINPHTFMYSQTCLKSLSIKDSLIFHECTVHIILNLHIWSNCSIKGTFSVSIECPLYTGFTVFQQEMILMCKCTWKRTISKF